MDTLFSYNIGKENISANFAKNTIKVNDIKMLIASTKIDQKFATNIKRLTFAPQEQLVYQRLIFNVIENADNLKLISANLAYMQIGGRETKTIINIEKNRALFFGKVNLLQTFSDDVKIQAGDIFSLDSANFAIERGFDINAQLSR